MQNSDATTPVSTFSVLGTLTHLPQSPAHTKTTVHAGLSPLHREAPSFEKFAAIVESKPENYSGGPSGLQFKHLQNWKPEMLAVLYKRLAKMWHDHSIPDPGSGYG